MIHINPVFNTSTYIKSLENSTLNMRYATIIHFGNQMKNSQAMNEIIYLSIQKAQ